MIKDELKINIGAGKGGDGGVRFGGGKPPKPTGGIGGKGGDIYVEGSTDYYDLNYMVGESSIKAQGGQVGGVNDQRGGNGADLTIKVPLVTQIYDQNGKLVCTIKEKGERILLLTGGEGGLGNHYFRRGFEGRFDKANPGKPGAEIKATLMLKLVADIVFIGFPNAGKSSLLNALTNAHVKVGAYPFTTLSPHLGRLPGLTLMDLPGLIEGTASGKGLGTGFIKHTEFARLVAHVISLESEDLLKDYNTMRSELKDISKDLYNKKEIIVLTKTDTIEPEEIKKKVDLFKGLGIDVVTCSSFVPDTLPKVEKGFRDNLV